MNERDLGMAAARRNIKAVRDFMYHLMVFLFVNGLLVIIDVRAGVGDRAVLEGIGATGSSCSGASVWSGMPYTRSSVSTDSRRDTKRSEGES